MLRAAKPEPGEDVASSSEAEGEDAPQQAELEARVRAALAGDPSALRAFLTTAAPLVRRICRGVMGRDNPDLEDAIQDCLIDVARALPHFRFEGSPSHYVTKIALRRAIANRQRARARVRQHSSIESSALPSPGFDSAQDGRADLLRKLLDALNETQAKALLLHVMLGHSTDEIASITGVSVNTVKTRLRLAKEQLRRWLQRSGEGRRAG